MNITKQWQILLHDSIKFGRGKYPNSRYIIFNYWDIGPLQIRRYVCADEKNKAVDNIQDRIISRVFLWLISCATLAEGLVGVFTLGFWRPWWTLAMARRMGRWELRRKQDSEPYPFMFGLDWRSHYKSLWLGWWLVTWRVERWRWHFRVCDLNVAFQPGL